MERLAIFAALKWECRPILRHLRRVTRTRLADFAAWHSVTSTCEIWLIKTGIGERRAAAAATAARAAGRFDLFLSTGCAGALAPTLLPGDLTIATKVVCDSSSDYFETDVAFRKRAERAAQRAALRTTVGALVCSPRALTTAAAKRTAATQSGAIAVEMEGAGIAAAAAEAGARFASIRAIFDTAATELDESGDFIDPQTGTLKLLSLVRHVVAQPSALAHLLALQPMMRAAQDGLDKFFGALLCADA